MTAVLDIRAVAGSRVNMRQGPGTNFPVLDTLDGGTQAEVLEVNANGWAQIEVLNTGQIGWMSTRLLIGRRPNLTCTNCVITAERQHDTKSDPYHRLLKRHWL